MKLSASRWTAAAVCFLLTRFKAVSSENITIVVLSYNEDELLKNCLNSIVESDLVRQHEHNVRLIVTNTNRTPLQLRITFELPPEVEVNENILASSHSTGHSARYWNQALIGGFDSLVAPVSKWVVTLQADSVLTADWWHFVKKRLDDGCGLFQLGYGDQLVVHTVDSVRHVGLFDERFYSIVHQEGEYFSRARMLYPIGTCINDPTHGRYLNFTEDIFSKIFARNVEPGHGSGSDGERKVFSDYDSHIRYVNKLIESKWTGMNVMGWGGPDNTFTPPPMNSRNPQPVLYPYFEKYLLRHYGNETLLLSL
jgi:hypothetical protein